MSLLQYFRILVVSTGQTIVLGLSALLLSTLLALFLVGVSLSGMRIVQAVTRVFSWLGRSTPEMIILFFTFLGLAQIGLRLEPMPAAILAFTIFCTAYNLEIFRGGFEGVSQGQYDAARALGLPYFRTMRRIVLPQVIRIVTPAYMTNAVATMKHTSLASVVAVSELTSTAKRLVVTTHHPFEILGMAGLIYIFINSVLVGVQTVAERRWHFEI